MDNKATIGVITTSSETHFREIYLTTAWQKITANLPASELSPDEISRFAATAARAGHKVTLKLNQHKRVHTLIIIRKGEEQS